MKPLRVRIIQKKVIEQYFHVVPFIMLYKMFQSKFKSVDKNPSVRPFK